MDKNYIVRKSNYFIMNSSYDLSLEEQKIILTLASMVQKEDGEFKPYKFKIADFLRLLNIENKAKYTETPKITRELMKKVFEINEENKLIQVAWLSSAEYEKGSGEVELQFSPKLKPYMLKLNELFTQYKLTNVLNMKSKYSPRIYEILKCNAFKEQKYIEIELKDLRELLKADKIYPLYGDFKRYILLVTQKEINEKTDIFFDFEEIKEGRKVVALKLYIHSNKKTEEKKHAPKDNSPDVVPGQIDAYEYLKELAATEETDKDSLDQVIKITEGQLTIASVQTLLKVANNDIENIKEKYILAKEEENIDDLGKWLYSAIKNDYKKESGRKKPKPKEKRDTKKTFKNFKEREYDPEKLKEGLLRRSRENPL